MFAYKYFGINRGGLKMQLALNSVSNSYISPYIFDCAKTNSNKGFLTATNGNPFYKEP